MNTENNSKFAHILKQDVLENFYKIMSGEKKVITKNDEEKWEAGYFAMCLLLPKKTFLEIIDVLGGIEKVKSDFTLKQAISRLFYVEPKLVSIRIQDLLSKQKTDIKESKVLKNIPKQQI